MNKTGEKLPALEQAGPTWPGWHAARLPFLPLPGHATGTIPVLWATTWLGVALWPDCSSRICAALAAPCLGHAAWPRLFRHGSQMSSGATAGSGPVVSAEGSPKAKNGRGREWPLLSWTGSGPVTSTVWPKSVLLRQCHVPQLSQHASRWTWFA